MILMTALKEYVEGKVTFVGPDIDHYTDSAGQPTASLPVFYNPRMAVNRDFSVLFLTTYMRDRDITRICEPLAGTGIRTLRYLVECPGDFSAVMFDANPLAVEVARKNVQLQRLEGRARVIHGDAKLLLLTESRERRFDFVDIDPFGSPTPYLNAAIQSIRPREGLIGITATDMPVLCGVYPHVALRKYGGLSMRTPVTHEIALRLLVHRVYHVAGMNDFSVRLLASLSTDHYVRIWMSVRREKHVANRQTRDIGVVLYCPGCQAVQVRSIQDLARQDTFEHETPECRQEARIAGPLWTGPLFDRHFMQSAEKAMTKGAFEFTRRTHRLFDRMLAECQHTQYPFYDVHVLCDMRGLSPPAIEDVVTALVEQGYLAARTHIRPTGIRTNATAGAVGKIIEEISRG